MSTTTSTKGTSPSMDEDLIANIQAMRDRMKGAGGPAFTPPPEPEAKIEPALKSAAKEETAFSKLWNIKAPKTLPDIAVSVVDRASVPVDVADMIPEDEATYQAQGLNEYMFTKAMEDNQRVLLTGPKGSGKSTLPKVYCARTNRPFFRFQARRTTEAEDLFGNISVRDGNVVFSDGPVTMAARYGGVVCIDEVSLLQAGAAMALQWLMEPGGKISLPDFPSADPRDKVVTPHREFRLVLTDNTALAGDSTGQYVGTNVQNAAFRDRIDMFIKVGYMNPTQEFAMIMKHVPDVPADVLKNMIKVGTEIRNGYEKASCDCTISPRVLLRWAKDTVAFGDPGFSFRYSFVNSVSPEDEAVVASVYQKVFGTAIPA